MKWRGNKKPQLSTTQISFPDQKKKVAQFCCLLTKPKTQRWPSLSAHPVNSQKPTVRFLVFVSLIVTFHLRLLPRISFHLSWWKRPKHVKNKKQNGGFPTPNLNAYMRSARESGNTGKSKTQVKSGRQKSWLKGERCSIQNPKRKERLEEVYLRRFAFFLLQPSR